MRTYPPIASSDGIVLLGWKHASGPGARWMSDVSVGTEARFTGPQRPLELAPGPVILVGDETSVTVAASFEAERPGRGRAVFQVGSVDEVREAAAPVGLRSCDVLARDRPDDVVEAVAIAGRATPEAAIALTGGSELCLAVRQCLRARGIRDLKTKTYWSPAGEDWTDLAPPPLAVERAHPGFG